MTGILRDSDIFGGVGNDTVTLQGVSTNATVKGLAGNDNINLQAAVTGGLINGNAGTDTFTSTGANTYSGRILGGADNDTFTLNGAAQTVTGTINGNKGADTMNIQLAANMAAGSTIFGGQGSDVITTTGAFAAIVSGDNGDDRITTNAGADTIFGGDGADVIATGTGVDAVTLGAGNDTVSTTNGGVTTVLAAGGGAAGAGIVAGDVFTLTGEAVVSDFAAGVGGDRVDMGTLGVTNNGVGVALVTDSTYAIAGTYAAATNTFTVGANNTTGNDTLIITLVSTATNGGASYTNVAQDACSTMLAQALGYQNISIQISEPSFWKAFFAMIYNDNFVWLHAQNWRNNRS